MQEGFRYRDEMTGTLALIETIRGFEVYMRAAERLDQVTARAISDVGRV